MKIFIVILSLVCTSVFGYAQQADIKAVNLGLPSGTLWGDRNIGAATPEDYGKAYNCSQYKDYVQKYTGENWGPPSVSQLRELSLFCKREYVKINGIYYFKLIGPNGNYIILPKEKSNSSGICCYWSRDFYQADDVQAYLLECAYYKYNKNLIDYAKIKYCPKVIDDNFTPFIRPVYCSQKDKEEIKNSLSIQKNNDTKNLASDKENKTTETTAQNNTATYIDEHIRKVALVIGNASYAKSPLKNPLNDADDISRKLKSLGFEVITVKDCKTKREMRKALETFCTKASKADAGLFYYSGHGMQLTKEGGNYLIPTEAEMTSEADVTDNCMGLEYVLNKMDDCGIQMKVAIIDACRDNPFRTWNRSGSKGLATVTNAPYGTFIAFATSANDVAADGNERNSPFTSAFLTALNSDNLEINSVFTAVKGIVKKKTNGGQRPWITNDLSEPFYFGKVK